MSNLNFLLVAKPRDPHEHFVEMFERWKSYTKKWFWCRRIPWYQQADYLQEVARSLWRTYGKKLDTIVNFDAVAWTALRWIVWGDRRKRVCKTPLEHDPVQIDQTPENFKKECLDKFIGKMSLVLTPDQREVLQAWLDADGDTKQAAIILLQKEGIPNLSNFRELKRAVVRQTMCRIHKRVAEAFPNFTDIYNA